MKKIYLLLLLVAGFGNAQVVDIPDPAFKSALLATNSSSEIAHDANGNNMAIDSNADGQIQTSEALAVYKLSVGGTTISNLTGISAFTNLDSLYVTSTAVATIDVSMLSNLQLFDCQQSQLTTLDLTANTNLVDLICYTNPLVSLNVSGLVNLKRVWIGNPELGPVDLSSLVNLESLGIESTAQTSIDLSPFTHLKDITLAATALTTIDLSHNPELIYGSFSTNQNLQYLNLKNGVATDFTQYGIIGNPNLIHICVDESDIASLNALNNEEICCNHPDLTYNSYCTFTPGGDYNTIKGALTYDADNNGCDAADVITTRFIKVNIGNGSETNSIFTGATGGYQFYVQDGTHTVTPEVEVPAYFNVSPGSAVVNFPVVDNSIETRNFCITANGSHSDLEVVIVPIDWPQPGFDVQYKIVCRNKGTQMITSPLLFDFNDDVLDFVSASPAPSVQSPNSLRWLINALLPFETRTIDLTLNINSPTEIPAVNAGDVLAYTANLHHNGPEETLEDNTFTLTQTAVNAYDPNDKTCLEGANVLPEHIGKYLHYNINFENIGTADAINIVVKDTIDTTRFDINTLQFLYASHPVYTKIRGNIVEFIFENINLPPSIMNPIGGHGNVLFKIKTLPTLTVGDEVSNTANIYFDYNAPIDTNEARTAFNNLSKSDFVKDDSVTVYPNPAKNKVTVKATGIVKSVQLYDVQGRILQSVSDGKSQVTLDIANQQRGVYFLRITTDKGKNTQKIIKE